MEFFGISIQQASLDLAKYMELAPANLEYDKSQKVYRPAKAFRPLFMEPDALAFLTQLSGWATGTWPSALSFLGWRPDYDLVPQPARTIQPHVLMRVLWAIRDHEDLEITYQAMRYPAPVRQWIAPHAIASDGSRWHTRAWCHENNYFRDFVLARIQSIHAARRSDIDANTDVRWQTSTTVELRASRELTAGQRRAVETEFGMQDGTLSLTMREALLPYFVRQWQLDDAEQRPARGVLIEWVNKTDLQDHIQKDETHDISEIDGSGNSPKGRTL
ncbi:MAG: helix-turn-helix transcriptional regulator [Steroidobacteraceae bacterium]